MPKAAKRKATLPPLASDREEAGPPDIQRRVISHNGVVLREALVEPAAWKDPDDTAGHIKRDGARLVHGFQAAWQITKLQRTSPRDITEQHVAAAHRFLNDWDLSNGAAASCLREATGGSDGVGAAALNACTAVRLAREAVGATAAELMIAVVVHNRAIGAYATARRDNPSRVLGRFAAAMDRLVEHYDTVGEIGARRGRNAGRPSHVGLSRSPIMDGAVVDIPQNRLGRVMR
jgi:hypothetical protein